MYGKLNIIHIIGRYWKILSTIINISLPSRSPTAELIRCTVDDDCPIGGLCFKDECARCLCPKGQEIINLYQDNKLFKICQARTSNNHLVGMPCNNDSDKQCPKNSYCDISQNKCVCDSGDMYFQNDSLCRFRMFGESCSDEIKCEEILGLKCKGRPPKCKCQASHHRPSKWTKHVLKRWNYSTVDGEPQECIARVVGEPCQSSRDCDDIYGSGAECNECKFCACKIKEHVPDVLGTRCGPGLGLGEACSLNSKYVCDGTNGLQCGDVCSIYEYDFREKTCTCSQMHDRVNDQCIQKAVNSPCFTDLDCYPVKEGFGHCDNGRCVAVFKEAPKVYQPHLVRRACPKDEKLSTLNSSILIDQEIPHKYKKHMSQFDTDSDGYSSVLYNRTTTLNDKNEPQSYAASSDEHSLKYFQIPSLLFYISNLLSIYL